MHQSHSFDRHSPTPPLGTGVRPRRRSASVAVIIAARNAGPTIADTLESLIAQDFADWEAIVINDGSSDDTGDIAEAFALRDPRLRVIHARHGGVSAARNAGVAATEAPWIQFLDADDQLQPHHLGKMMATARADVAAEVVYSDWRIIGENRAEGARQQTRFPVPPAHVLSRTVNVLVHGLLLRRDVLVKAGLFQPGMALAEDWDLWLRIARMGARFRPAPKDVVARYTMRKGSACTSPARVMDASERVLCLAGMEDSRIQDRVTVPPFKTDELQSTIVQCALWASARHLAGGGDPLDILRGRDAGPLLPVMPTSVTASIFMAMQQALADPRPDWPALWPDLRGRLSAMLDHVAGQTLSPLFTDLAMKGVEQLAINQLDPALLVGGETRQVGRWLLARVDLARLQLPAVPEGACFARVQVERDGALLCEVVIHADRLTSPERFALIEGAVRTAAPLDPAEIARWKAMEDAPTEEDRLEGCRASPDEAAEIAAELRQAAGRGSARVLLLAAGDGHLAEALDAAGFHVRATESDPERKRALHLRFLRNRNLRVSALDPVRDPLEGSHDLVVLPAGLRGLWSDNVSRTLLDRLWAVVAPGGRLAIVVPESAGADPDREAENVRLFLRDTFALSPQLRRVGKHRLIIAERSRQGEAPVSAPFLTLPSRPWQPDGIPVLMYHRVATDPLPGLAHYAVTPQEFRAQMECLAGLGATALTLDQFEAAQWQGAPLPERPVLITFDDGYVDTLTEAVPVMRETGMTATVFIPTAHVGGSSAWDAAFGPCAPLMGWHQLRDLRDMGFSLAAHSHAHVPLAALDLAALGRELDLPRDLLRQELGVETRSIAYPYGSFDQAVEWEVFGAGYQLAFTTEGRRFGRGDKVMAIPRLDVARGMSLDKFARMVTG